ERLAELRAQESELANTLEQQRENLKLQIRAAWMEGDAPALKVLLNEIEPSEVARTLTYYEYLSKNTVSRLEAFQRSLQELKAARAAVQATRTELAKTEADLEQRQQQLTQSRQDRARTLAALNDDIQNRRSERQSLEADRQRLEQLLKEDRKSTRLNSSHVKISYAVFCLKKKNGRDASGQEVLRGLDGETERGPALDSSEHDS